MLRRLRELPGQCLHKLPMVLGLEDPNAVPWHHSAREPDASVRQVGEPTAPRNEPFNLPKWQRWQCVSRHVELVYSQFAGCLLSWLCKAVFG